MKVFYFKYRLFLVSLVFLNFELNAQILENPFSSVKEEKELIYGIDNRRTRIQNQSTLIYGLYMGIGFGDKLRFKLGVSGTPFEVGELKDENSFLMRNRLVFINLGEEFDFLIKNRFRLTTYLQAGWGYNYFRVIDNNNVEINRSRNMIIPVELGLHAGYHILPWLQFKLGGGWRFVFPQYSSDLSGYYLKIAFGISSRKLLKSYRDWKLNKVTDM